MLALFKMNSGWKKGKSPKPYRAQISPLQVVDGEAKIGKRMVWDIFLWKKHLKFFKKQEKNLFKFLLILKLM